jgi:FAD/FMN-containing dehydrogenase
MRLSEQGTVPSPRDDIPGLNDLRSRLEGNLILPDDTGYDEAREVFNAMIDRRPAAIAQCATTSDVVACIDVARSNDIPVTVRGGGHGVAGHSVSDDSLMIDLSLMKDIQVDVDSQIAHVGPGVRLGELIETTEKFGLVSPTGTASNTGVAGLTLGGGIGWLGGKYGLAVDNLVGAEVVLSDGSVVNANADEHQDLYWALRGGSGNFGVVTRFDLRLHAVSEVIGGMLIYPFDRAQETLQFVRDMTKSAPDELTVAAALTTDPEGNKVVAFIVCWCGDREEGERVLAPLRAFGPPLADLVEPMPYSRMNTLIDDAVPAGARHYWKQAFAKELSDGAIDALIEQSRKAPTAGNMILIDVLQGAITRIAPDATAFAHRDAGIGIVMLSIWTDPADDDTHIGWTRGLFEAFRPFSTGGVYLNESQEDRSQAVFGANYARLAEIKYRYDPTNMFNHNANITPALHAAD